MSGLKIIVLTDDAERFRGGLILAITHNAMGGNAAVFLQLDAVRLLAPGMSGPRDTTHLSAGLPDLATLITEALDADVQILICQTGLALCGMDATMLDPRIQPSGPITFLHELAATDRLLCV
jgi:predicted peroxiredoxin